MSLLGGNNDYAATVIELLGVDAYVQAQSRIARGWSDAAQSQDRYSQSAARMSNAGNILTAGVTAPLLLLGSATAKLGIAATESENLVKVTFGNMTSDIDKWSNSTAKSLGLNAFEMRRQAATMQSMFTGAGFQAGGAEKMSKSLVDLKNDMVSFFNTADDDTFAALQSGLAGETEPLRKYGIFLTESTLQSYALAHGIGKANEQLTEQQKIAARFGFIKERMDANRVTGDLERTKDSPANQLRRIQNELKAAGTELGMALTPLIGSGLKGVNSLLPPLRSAVDLFTHLPQPIQTTAIALGLATGPALKLGGFLMNLRNVSNLAATAKQGLTAATKLDIAAEQTKAGVANAESAAISGVGKSATDTAGKLSLLARSRAFLGAPIGGLHTLGGFGQDAVAVSRGAAMGAGVLGAAAGYGVKDDLATIGDPNALAKGMATGVAAAAASMFVPGAAVPIAIATGFRYLFNEAVNRPMEQEAERGDGIDSHKLKGKSASEQADVYLQRAEQLRNQRNTILSRRFLTLGDRDPAHAEELDREIAANMTIARGLQNRARNLGREEKSRQAKSWSADMDKAFKRFYPGGPGATVSNARGDNLDDLNAGSVSRAFEGDWSARARDAQAGPIDSGTRNASVRELRNGETVVRLPRREADDMNTALRRHNSLRTNYGG